MTSLSELESDAQHLRACLQRASPLHSLLCGLQFFEKLAADSRPAIAGFIEASLREFIPDLVTAISKTDASDLSPSEAKNLAGLQALAHAGRDVVASSDLAALSEFLSRVNARPPLVPPPVADDQVVLAGLFVEYNPDLRLPPRGRLLWLRVEAEERRHGKPDDEPVIRNSIVRPDDEFRHQADTAVKLAREYLISRHGLDPHKRFRIDFDVLGSPAALTGPSLGLAMAVGAVVAIAKREVLRCTLEVPTGVAFSGALSDDGGIRSIDGEGLRLKLACALHTGLKHLVVPRAHITEAWEFLRSQEASRPEHPLRLIDADDLASVVDDRNLVFPQRRTRTAYHSRRARRKLREPRVGIPILAALLAILYQLLVPPQYRVFFDDTPASAAFNLDRATLEVFNRDSVLIWSKELPCQPYGDISVTRVVHDVTGDQEPEVLWTIPSNNGNPYDGWLFCYSSDGEEMWRRYTAVMGEYPGDTTGSKCGVPNIAVVDIDGRTLIITEVNPSFPSRGHIRIWNGRGDSLGWYINAGGTGFRMAKDIDGDGRTELIFQGYNYRMPHRGTCLLVLRADSLSGCSPPYSKDTGYDLTWIKRGTQTGYVFFPSCPMVPVDMQPGISQPEQIFVTSDGVLDVHTGESNTSVHARIIYRLDNHLRLTQVRFTDQYETRHAALAADGKLPPLDSAYIQGLRDSVLIWTSAGWRQTFSSK